MLTTPRAMGCGDDGRPRGGVPLDARGANKLHQHERQGTPRFGFGEPLGLMWGDGVAAIPIEQQALLPALRLDEERAA